MTIAAVELNPIWQAYERPGDNSPHLLCRDGDTYRPYRWDDWRNAAERTATGLRQLGVVPGTRVACVLTNTFAVCATVVGTWLAGGVVLSLPTMRRGMAPDEYVEQLRRLVQSSGAELLLFENKFMEFVQGDLGAPVHSFESLPADGAFEPTPPDDDDLAFVQYSSGSTNDPKGCMLSLRAIAEQELMLQERIGTDGDDMGVMWLPLSHDMGLFGCVLLSWVSGMRLAVGTPERFLRKPRTWMEDCAELQATISVAPNFGLALAARMAGTRPPSRPFPMRRVILGGERVSGQTLQSACDVLGPYGVTMDTLVPAYGLAEATLAVSMKPMGEYPKAIAIDQEAAYRGELEIDLVFDAGTREIVSCGPPMRHVSVRSTSEEGVGRICIRSAALADGYLNEPEKTEAAFVDGEFISEDLGFIRDGELYVIGRIDDVIPVGGRNLHAHDVEVAVERCAGVRPGCCALVDIQDEEQPRLLLVAEPDKDVPDLSAVATEVAQAAYHAGGTRVAEVVFVRRGSLPKTPSGKIQRFRCRQLAARGASEVLERIAV